MKHDIIKPEEDGGALGRLLAWADWSERGGAHPYATPGGKNRDTLERIRADIREVCAAARDNMSAGAAADGRRDACPTSGAAASPPSAEWKLGAPRDGAPRDGGREGS
jgi:hypothetical protein